MIGSLLLASAIAWAAQNSKISVTANPNPVSEGESTQLNVVIDSEGTTSAYPPDFDSSDFTLLGASQSGGTTSTYQNGAFSTHTQMRFSYVLAPKKVGDLVIKNIRVKAGSETLTAPDVHIKVTADGTSKQKHQQAAPDEDQDNTNNPASPQTFQGYQPTQPTDSDDEEGDLAKDKHPGRFNSDFTVQLRLSKKTAYVGEPILADFYVYDLGGLRQLEIQRWPAFNGFWKEDLHIASRFEFEEVYVGNRPMRRVFIARYALYGIKPGRFSLDKLAVKGAFVSRGNFGNDLDEEDPISMFMGSFGQVKTAVHANDDVNIEILPLPENGKPQNFNGAVGKFTLDLKIDKTIVPANTPLTITTSLAGKGNFQAIDGIKVNLPSEFELYETTTNAPAPLPIGAKRSLESTKSFQTIAIPRKPGKYTIASSSFTYFDPDKKSYQTLTTKPIEIEVEENNNVSNNSNTYLPSSPPGGGGSGGGPTTGELSFKAMSGSFSFFKYLAYLNYLLAMAAVALALRFFYGKRYLLENAINKIDPWQTIKTQIKDLRASSSKTSSPKKWLNDAEEIMYEIIEKCINENPRGFTRGELHDHWKNSKLSPEIFHKIEALLSHLDEARFAKGATSAGKDKIIDDLDMIVKSLPKKMT